MRKIILGLLAAVAIAAPIAATSSANAAPGPNHGQCVSSAVKAGVEGDAFKAIAQNNSLVGVYGSATCPAPPVIVPAHDKADGDLTWTVDLANFGFGGIVNGTVQFNADVAGGALHYTNDYDGGKFLNATVDPGTYVRTGSTATFRGTITDASPMYNGGTGYIVVQIVDGGGASGGDKIAVFVNEEPHDNILADVVTGNLVIN